LKNEQNKKLEWEIKFLDVQNTHSNNLNRIKELEEKIQQLEEINKDKENKNEELNIAFTQENLKKNFENQETVLQVNFNF
jgi:hypothetical protein